MLFLGLQSIRFRNILLHTLFSTQKQRREIPYHKELYQFQIHPTYEI